MRRPVDTVAAEFDTVAAEFVTVDLRGRQAALMARARADRVSVSSLVRTAVARELG